LEEWAFCAFLKENEPKNFTLFWVLPVFAEISTFAPENSA
jgi:hypothetical protein